MKKKITIIITLLLLFGVIFYIIGNNMENQENLEIKQYEIRFLVDGIELDKFYVKNGEYIKTPENPTKEGYTFRHWATHENSIDGSEKFDFNNPITTHTTLFAHFTLKPSENNNENNNSTYGYEKIYNQYSARLKNECPNLSITECAEISNEGVSEMAKYMYKASGTDGQYATYEQWASKLMDVYLQEAR